MRAPFYHSIFVMALQGGGLEGARGLPRCSRRGLFHQVRAQDGQRDSDSNIPGPLHPGRPMHPLVT